MKPFTRFFLLLASVGGVAGVVFGYYIINHGFHLVPESLKKLLHEADLLENAEAKDCSKCHKTIYEAWKKSRHSQAWIDEIYIKDSDNRSKEKCLPCHIPQVVRAGIKPDPRTWVRDDGVYCVPCHVVDKEMNGPYDLFAPPHPTRQNPEYRKAKICGTCHQKTLKEWEATGTEKTCQTCHMPRSDDRRLTQKFPFSLLHSKKSVADHRFPHGEIEKDDLKFEARVEDGAVVVVLQNMAIPHQVPTAENGDPRLYLYVLLYDASAQEVDRYKEIFAPQQETALPFGKKMEFRYPLPTGTTADVSLQYQPAWAKEKSELRKISLPPRSQSK